MKQANPINLAGIDHVVLRARDFEGLIEFYTDVIGCGLERVSPSYGIAQLRAGQSLVDIVDVSGRLGQMGGTAPDHQAESQGARRPRPDRLRRNQATPASGRRRPHSRRWLKEHSP